VTDLEVNNGGTTTATYELAWLVRKADNSSPTMSEEFTLGAGESERFEDVVLSVFNTTGNGALAVVSESEDLLIFSRTYNDADIGTFGTAVPGIAESDLVQGSIRKRLLYFTEDGDFRSNIAFQNGIGSNLRVKWERYLADGTMVESGTTDLAPYSNKQLNAVYKNEAPIEAAYMDVWTETSGGKFMVFSSVVDNATSDGTVVQPQLNAQAPPPSPDLYNVCGLGNCAIDGSLSKECSTFMDQCLTEGGFADAQCVVGGFLLCNQDDAPEEPDPEGICTLDLCHDDNQLAQECQDFLDNCPFSSDRRCLGGAFLICHELFDIF
jgi:hypothetical protein